MIFLTTGTHEPFDRLLRAVDAWYGSYEGPQVLFAQAVSPARGAYRPHSFQPVPRLAQAEYARHFAAADLIVSHAGMGTIITALSAGKPIVIMPRRGHLRETRNDHQFMTVRELGKRKGIFVALDEGALAGTMDLALRAIGDLQVEAVQDFAESSFTDALRQFILHDAEAEPATGPTCTGGRAE